MSDESLDRRLGADPGDDSPRDDGFGDVDRTPAEAADAAVNLDDPDSTDNLPWSPPDSAPIHAEFEDDRVEETIDQRIAQEEPEEGTAYGAPEPRGILGGADDPGGSADLDERRRDDEVLDADGRPDRELTDLAEMSEGEDPYEDVEVDVLDDQA